MKTVTQNEKAYKVLGYTQDITSCDCCGRVDLKGTLVLENLESGEIQHFGVVCGAKIAKSTTKVLKDVLTETEKENLRKARIEFRASAEYMNDEKYMEQTNKIFDSTVFDFNTRLPYINERMRLGKITDEKRRQIAIKYFVQHAHKI